ncbi:MAG: CorA family divalent cation transporter [Clostridiales bacterium]|nr:CorA family divalent cation transporter [Clostridiales bacterium]
MKYKLNRKLIPIFDESQIESSEILVEIMTLGEFDEKYKGNYHHELLMDSMEHIQYSKVEILRSCTIGTILVPDKQDLLEKEFGFGFYIHKRHVIFIDDTKRLQKIAARLPEIKAYDTTLEARFFIEIIEFLINDDVLYLQRYEDMLVDVEEELLEHTVDDFHTDMLRYRREIMTLNSYYQQMTEALQMMSENKNGLFNAEDIRLLRVVANRADRLYDNTKMLREYTVQLREMYQSQIDIEQNKTMRILTVVTTIFMPLTLIAGWYGMNFEHMPELHSPYGYIGVIAFSVLVVVGEIIFFKWKKWFD